MSTQPFQRSSYLAIRAASLETRVLDRRQAEVIAVSLQRAATAPPVAKPSGLLARLRRVRGQA